MVVQVLAEADRRKIDSGDDALFYAAPRFVQHLDGGFRARLTELYRRRLPAGADLLDRATPTLASAEIVARVEKARPSAKGKLKVERLFSWQKSPFARGIYHHIGTGQAAILAAATQAAGQRLVFAGEHLAQESSGMEAALESGERAAQTILTRY